MTEQNSKEDTEKLVKQMRDWLNSQPHLPKDIDDKLLVRFLHSCYYDVEQAQKTAELFFVTRGSATDLISNRDPLSPQMQKALKIVNLAQLRISGNRVLWIWQLNDPGLENYDYFLDAKVFFLSTDGFMLDDQGHLEDGDIVILDVKDISLKFITKFNMSIARKLSRYQEEAMPIRLKQIHVVNAPSFIDKIFSLMKPILKPEITEMMHFHSAKSDTLYQYLGKEDLPADYGGSLAPMEEHMKVVMKMLLTHRDQLLNDKLWVADKKSKSSKPDSSSKVDAPAFRALAID